MTLVDLVAQRIESEVPELAGAIEGIAELAALVEQEALPQRDVAAFVVPLGFDNRGGDQSSVNVHIQILAEAVGVVLCIKARGDVKASKALPKIDALVQKVITKLAGWAPDDAVGVFYATRGRLIPGGKGIILYQIDFELMDQLRIVS
ncbi:hypothetical protein AAFX91_21820 [Bradyrhizobium sp. 31Argb]|uniref:phage tail terminator protein n=1 Tax=Bradyrhizobium sp. 31Argb TaxID=3141247 RepID=UPI003747CFD4